jgi:hypothetical protein
MYTNNQRMSYEKCGCDNVAMPPDFVLDAIAEEKLQGLDKNASSSLPTWNFKRRNTETCPTCNIKLPVSGQCDSCS